MYVPPEAVMLLLGVLWGRNSHAQAAAAESTLALTQPELSAPTVLSVRSSAFDQGRPIPDRHSAYHSGISPRLEWSGLPAQARSLVLILEDPDAAGPLPFAHWLLYNMPVRLHGLPEGLPHDAVLQSLAGTLQGKNSTGRSGYFGPMPPRGDTPHHYHFQLFALDRMLELPPGAERQTLLQAMKGHVLAKGELIGTYQKL